MKIANRHLRHGAVVFAVLFGSGEILGLAKRTPEVTDMALLRGAAGAAAVSAVLAILAVVSLAVIDQDK